MPTAVETPKTHPTSTDPVAIDTEPNILPTLGDSGLTGGKNLLLGNGFTGLIIEPLLLPKLF